MSTENNEAQASAPIDIKQHKKKEKGPSVQIRKINPADYLLVQRKLWAIRQLELKLETQKVIAEKTALEASFKTNEHKLHVYAMADIKKRIDLAKEEQQKFVESLEAENKYTLKNMLINEDTFEILPDESTMKKGG